MSFEDKEDCPNIMYKSQEMPNLRRFLARFLSDDNQMTIIYSFSEVAFSLKDKSWKSMLK